MNFSVYVYKAVPADNELVDGHSYVMLTVGGTEFILSAEQARGAALAILDAAQTIDPVN